MHTVVKKSVRSLIANLGHCPKCMRQAFLAALTAWALAIAIKVSSGRDLTAIVTMAVALGLTGLWMTHLGVYAARVAAAGKYLNKETNKSPAAPSRRELVGQIGHVALAVGAGAFIALRASTALGAGNCDCSKCSSSQACCPTANGYCGCFPVACPK
jgi:hypothetical protein